MKKYVNLTLVYAILAMVGGVFYREFTKFNDFTGRTALGVVHTHYFMLGMVFFLLLLLLEKNFSFTAAKTVGAGCLSNWIKSDCCYVCDTWCGAGTGDGTVFRYGCGNLRYGRHWPYFAGSQSIFCWYR